MTVIEGKCSCMGVYYIILFVNMFGIFIIKIEINFKIHNYIIN